LLRSNCRVTNQPDWGDIYIYMAGDTTPTHASILQYIVSLRGENHFHEEICECVYKRLIDKFNPKHIAVGCFYTRRGGIDINPVRASSEDLAQSLFGSYLNLGTIVKTVRQ
jgi:7-cyano-7-deazaguanine reductase